MKKITVVEIYFWAMVAIFATIGYASADIIKQSHSGPAVNINFMSGVLDPDVTFTRSGVVATFFDNTGTLQTSVANVPRFDYDPSTLQLKGLLVEGPSTNSVRNNTMVGAVAGSPGTLPTNWSSNQPFNVIGTGVENGITYIDIEFTSASPATAGLFTFDPIANTVASPAQIWTSSSYVKLVGGSLTNVSDIELTVRYSDSSQTFISQQFTIFTPTNAALRTQKIVQTFTSPALTAFVQTGFRYNTSGAYDFTLRIGMPQLELQSFATSVIATAGSTVTRLRDNVTVLPAKLNGSNTSGAVAVRAIPEGIKNISWFQLGLSVAAVNSMQGFTTGLNYSVLAKLGVNTTVSSNTNGDVTTDPATILFSQGPAGWEAAVNGTLMPGSGGSGSIVAFSGTALSLFIGNGFTSGPFYGWIQTAKYWKRSLSAKEAVANSN